MVGLIALVGCTFNPPLALPRGPGDQALEGARFEVEPIRRAGLVAADLFWLVDGDQVFVTWTN